jgi:phospholipid/cholesterol/gamma-HCH transport system substrate-binding protein
MITERVRNILVGLTLLATIVVAVIGSLILGKVNSVTSPPYEVKVTTGSSGGLTSGSKVDFNGVQVGAISKVELTADMRGVNIVLAIQSDVKIPTGSYVVIGKQTLGSSYLSVVLPPTPTEGFLPTNGTAVLPSKPVDSGFIPQSVLDDVRDLKVTMTKLSEKIAVVADDLHVLLQPVTPEQADQALAQGKSPVANISTLVQRLDRSVAGLEKILSDPVVQQQTRDLIGNLSAASADLRSLLVSARGSLAKVDTTVEQFGSAATQASGTLSTTQKQILVVSEQLVSVLENLNKTMNAVVAGKGTTGKLINDPRLYESLVDVSTSLQSTMKELTFLLRKWKEEGVNLKLGG